MLASMEFPRDAVGGSVLGDKVYAVGGYDGQHYLKSVETYDPASNEWTEVASLCTGRAGTCVVRIQAKNLLSMSSAPMEAAASGNTTTSTTPTSSATSAASPSSASVSAGVRHAY